MYILEEISRDWKVSLTPETVGTSVSGILGASYEFWDEEEEDGPLIIRVEEQEWLEIIKNLLTDNAKSGARRNPRRHVRVREW